MEKFILIIVIIWSAWTIHCATRRRKYETIKNFIRRTGEAVAIDELIRQYEREHQKFCKEETKKGDYLEWPALDNKNLIDYCRKYLHHSIPENKSIDIAIGVKVKSKLRYEKENTSINNEIIVVQCKIEKKTYHLKYYITRAPEVNCVYSLKCARHTGELALSIIYKHCDFEENTVIKSLKRKRKKIDKMHRYTGQPIAKDEYLLKYEIEHHELIKKEKEGKYINWPHATAHHNLNTLCYQYMRECVPSRNREGVKGSWKIGKLYYRKLKIKIDINVTMVTCTPNTVFQRYYHMTRAPEVNCVYALVRIDRINLFKIVFKHCSFEDLKDQRIVSQDYDIRLENIITKTEVKKEMFDITETLQLFPQH